MRAKTVIFVGGTSYSGSTMLDLMLANDPHGFSCGEVVNLFYPSRPFHLDPVCGCGETTCNVWNEVRKAGPSELYSAIFSMFPDIKLIVDSSKDVCWIRRQQKIVRRQGIDARNVLIWKTPDTMRNSFAKRGEAEKFEAYYVNYHKFYNASVQDWVGICYDELVTRPQLLGELCDRVGIEKSERKHEYWDRQQHVLFGNHAAKIHMYDQSHVLYERAEQRLQKIPGRQAEEVEHHRTIYSSTVEAVAPYQTGGSPTSEFGPRVIAVADLLRSKSVGGGSANVRTAVRGPALGEIGPIRCALRCGALWVKRTVQGMKYRKVPSRG